MINQDILTKAIEKATNNGWSWNSTGLLELIKHKKTGGWFWGYNGEYDENVAIYPAMLIFNHDFAKALWGECQTWFDNSYNKSHIPKDGWQYHLQQMVIANDPVAYLGANL